MNVVVSEGVESTWYYHLSKVNEKTHALCGARVFHTLVPLSAWGHASKLKERWCTACAACAAQVIDIAQNLRRKHYGQLWEEWCAYKAMCESNGRPVQGGDCEMWLEGLATAKAAQ